VDNLRQYAGDNANLSGFAPHPFAKLMALTKMANRLGYDKATDKALSQAAHDFTGPMWMGGPTIKCGVIPDMKAICNTNSRLYTYKGDGSWSDATDGQWIDILNPPKK
jgi:hypothetical protein